MLVALLATRGTLYSLNASASVTLDASAIAVNTIPFSSTQNLVLSASGDATLGIPVFGTTSVVLGASATASGVISSTALATVLVNSICSGILIMGGSASVVVAAGATASTIMQMSSSGTSLVFLSASASQGSLITASGSVNVVLGASGLAGTAFAVSAFASGSVGASASGSMTLLGSSVGTVTADSSIITTMTMGATGSNIIVAGATASGSLIIPANSTVNAVLNSLAAGGALYNVSVTASLTASGSASGSQTLVGTVEAILSGNALVTSLANLFSQAIENVTALASANTGTFFIPPAMPRNITVTLKIKPVGIFISRGYTMIVGTPSKQIVYPGCSQIIKVSQIGDHTSTPPQYWDGTATLKATLIDDLGNTVLGCIQIPLSYVANSNGDFIGSFGDVDFQPEPGTAYTMFIDGSNGVSTYHAELLVEVRANTGR